MDWREWEAGEIENLKERCFPWMIPGCQNGWWSRNLRLGEIACTLTHWNIWRFSWFEGFDRVIILEDDARILVDFEAMEELLVSLLKYRADWELLYLGRERVLPDRMTFGKFSRPGFSYCSYGYALALNGIKKLLATNLPNKVIPVDEFLPAMYMSHPRADVRAIFRPSISAYGLVQDVVEERSKKVWGSETEESPFLGLT